MSKQLKVTGLAPCTLGASIFLDSSLVGRA
jgi:hypothetical protein